ncbi:hypothetical protein BASA83_009988 [Batrachochytrium salamandrivorans]|nr:hypothetical protein BASA83_009988 [Batrachochytrium salamandrivorans]
MTSSIHKDPSNALSVSHSAADRFKTTDRSCQSLLSSLEDASLLSEDLCSHLAQHDLILTLGLDFYQSPSAESLALLKSPQLQLHSSKLSVCNDKGTGICVAAECPSGPGPGPVALILRHGSKRKSWLQQLFGN